MSEQNMGDIPKFEIAKYRPSAPRIHTNELSLTRKLLHTPSINNHLLAQQIKRGFPLSRLLAVQTFLKIDDRELAEISNILVQNVRRRKSGRLTPSESDTLYRLARLCQVAADLFDGDQRSAVTWLKRHNLALDNISPLLYAKSTPGEEEVSQLAGRLEQGVF